MEKNLLTISYRTCYIDQSRFRILSWGIITINSTAPSSARDKTDCLPTCHHSAAPLSWRELATTRGYLDNGIRPLRTTTTILSTRVTIAHKYNHIKGPIVTLALNNIHTYMICISHGLPWEMEFSPRRSPYPAQSRVGENPYILHFLPWYAVLSKYCQ